MELIIILVIVMIIFGVGRLPEVGGAMGKAIREFRKSQSDKGEAPSAEDDKPLVEASSDQPASGDDQSRTH